MRHDPLTGHRVVVAASRQGRPNLPADGCPFCPGGREAPEPYDVRWFPNRWPALPDGRAEVVLYTPDHIGSFGTLPPEQATRVVDLWADRSQALGHRPDVAYVLVFENRGPAVGATIAHPHGQIYAFEEVPPVARTELDAGPTAVRAALGPGAEGDDGARAVHRSGTWRSFVPFAPTWPYELVVAPDDPVPDLPALDRPGRADLAAALGDAVRRLDRCFGEEMPYMMWIHQRPFDGGAWPTAWAHLHVAPLLRAAGTARYVAAAELGSGVHFNPVDPLDAAAALRRAAEAPG